MRRLVAPAIVRRRIGAQFAACTTAAGHPPPPPADAAGSEAPDATSIVPNADVPATSSEGGESHSHIEDVKHHVGIVEEYSRRALEREGREGQVEAIVWSEDTGHYPILARGKRNIYDYTDDIPIDVKPLYSHQPYQTRKYFKIMRERANRPLWKRAAYLGVAAIALVFFGGAVEFIRIWSQQPQEIAAMRVQMLESCYGKVLELGAGHGLNIGSYPYPVHEIVMCDQSQTLLDKLHFRIPKTAYPKYGTVRDRAERLENFKDGEFDCVVDMFGLCHYRDPVMALRQMQRVVKPTGSILLLEHGRTPYPPVNWVLDYFSDRHTAHTHGCKWNQPLAEYFKEARLIVREMEQHHYGTTYWVVAHPEILDDAAMKRVPRRDQMLVR